MTGRPYEVRKSELAIRVLRGHKAGCTQPMVWVGSVERLDFRGRRHPHGRYSWLKLVCNLNNDDCAALALVRVSAIESTVEMTVQEVKG
jgi:hypothetical protein